MPKVSQLERALASLRSERDILDLAIRKLEAQQVTPGDRAAALKTSKFARSLRVGKQRADGEGATTDSGNMNYPPA